MRYITIYKVVSISTRDYMFSDFTKKVVAEFYEHETASSVCKSLQQMSDKNSIAMIYKIEEENHKLYDSSTEFFYDKISEQRNAETSLDEI